MKNVIKLSIYFSYLCIVILIIFLKGKNKNILLSANLISIALFSVRGVKNSYTAGDASILQFNSLFSESLEQSFDYNYNIKDLLNRRIWNVSTFITRDLISFVILDLLRCLGLLDCKIIYYATDIFYRRLDNKTNKIVSGTLKLALTVLEKTVWKRADYIFANRKDELSIVKSQNQRTSLVPAKSRVPNLTNLKLPSLDSGLTFLFIGASGNVPNRKSINSFIRNYWPCILKKFSRVELRIVGGGWEKYIRPTEKVNLTGFLSDKNLMEEYKNADFTIGYLDFGAGVKGKILESMEQSTVVLGNKIGFAGIECNALVPFKTSYELVSQIESFMDVDYYRGIIKEYEHFLLENYAIGLIKTEIFKVISEIKL